MNCCTIVPPLTKGGTKSALIIYCELIYNWLDCFITDGGLFFRGVSCRRFCEDSKGNINLTLHLPLLKGEGGQSPKTSGSSSPSTIGRGGGRSIGLRRRGEVFYLFIENTQNFLYITVYLNFKLLFNNGLNDSLSLLFYYKLRSPPSPQKGKQGMTINKPLK